jgi:large subunit ribosomal protein L9
MQVILREDVEHLGRSGEVVSVRNGYGRNYLIPQGLAVVATPKNVNRIEHEKQRILARTEKLEREAQKRAATIEAASISIAAAVGEENRLFGSVTSKDVEQALRENGIDVTRKAITMPEDQPIKALGMYTVHIKLHSKVSAKLKLWVVAK